MTVTITTTIHPQSIKKQYGSGRKPMKFCLTTGTQGQLEQLGLNSKGIYGGYASAFVEFSIELLLYLINDKTIDAGVGSPHYIAEQLQMLVGNGDIPVVADNAMVLAELLE